MDEDTKDKLKKGARKAFEFANNLFKPSSVKEAEAKLRDEEAAAAKERQRKKEEDWAEENKRRGYYNKGGLVKARGHGCATRSKKCKTR